MHEEVNALASLLFLSQTAQIGFGETKRIPQFPQEFRADVQLQRLFRDFHWFVR